MRILTSIYVLLLSFALATPASALEVVFIGSTGSEDFDLELREASQLVTIGKRANPVPLDTVSAAQTDYRAFTAVLYDRGYFGGTISILLDGREAASISPLELPANFKRGVITVSQGPQFRFGQAEVRPTVAETVLPDSFKPGQIARTGAIREAVEVAISDWRGSGHAKAAIASQDITAVHPKSQLNVAVAVSPGPKLTFGELIVSGNSAVRKERIREITGLPTGKVFHPEEVEKAAKRLRRTGTFRAVALSEAEETGMGNTLDINAQIVDQPLRRLGYGGELSSLEGLAVSAFWLHRNLLGGAERLRFEAEAQGIGGESGGIDVRLSARFDRPATFGQDTDFFALAELEHLEEVSFSTDKFLLEAGIKRYVTQEREYTLAFGLQTARSTDAFGTKNYTILTMPISATFDYRNDRLDATSGYYAFVDLTPFVGVNGVESGIRSELDARYYRGFGENDGLVFALRGQLGSVIGPSLANAPSDFLFYSGGGGTVRGQPYQSLAVDLGGGNAVGGRSFLGVSAEMRLKTSKKFGLVGFYDTGYIGAEAFPDGSGEWHSGAGVGVRYDTGIGPIRLDLAVPVVGDSTGQDFQIYVGIGQAF